MKRIIHKAAIKRAERNRARQGQDSPASSYQVAKAFVNLKQFIRRELINAFLLGMGVISAGFGLRSFILPNHFLDGGITGISLLFSQLSGYTLPFTILILNIPFVIAGFTQVGRSFVIKTSLGIIALSLCVALLPYPVITSDKTLVAAFGGFFLGAGIGLSMRGGGVLDGTEIMALYLSKKSGLSIGDVILIVNIIIFVFAAWLINMEAALYSILVYISASKTIDYIIEGIEEYTGVTIISAKSNEIRHMITEELRRGVTIYKGSRGFGKTGHKLGELDIIYSVVTRLEIARLKAEIEHIDPDAFVIMSSIKDTRGGMIKKRPLR